MSAANALHHAQACGVRVAVCGPDLVLDAHQEPVPAVVEALKRHKAEIVSLLTSGEGRWGAEDWRAFFGERAGIAEFDGGFLKEQAEYQAFEACVARWLAENPEASFGDVCVECRSCSEPIDMTTPVVFRGSHDAWVHDRCLDQWRKRRRAEGVRALAVYGIALSSMNRGDSAKSIREISP